MTSLRTLALGLLLGTTDALCAAESATANDAPARGRIVALGDSITAGYGLGREQAYPALLQAKIDAAGLPFEVVNAGVSGDTTAGGLRRVAWALGPGADVLIVALGGNDGLRGVAPEQTEKNIAGIIERARAKNPEVAVIVAAMQMPGNMGAEFAEEFRALFPQVAEGGDAALVPFLLEGVGGVAEFNQDDLIHPNAEGQKRVAENIWKVLRPLLEARAAQGADAVHFRR
jgi:acyl-CoA thioesterase-1